MKMILSIDQGTTGTRAVLINSECQILCDGYREHKQIYPHPGWVEHDPMEIWENVKFCVNSVMAKSKGLDKNDIQGIGIANQGETVMLWDKVTGLPVYNAIVWQCRRTSEYVQKLQKELDTEMVRQKTGLVLDAYFSASKIKWVIDNVPEVKEKIKQGRICAGTLDAWLIWKITAGQAFVTDPSTASRTMIFNINDLHWDQELLKIFDIPESILPQVLPTSGNFGVANEKELCGLSAPICGSVVDQAGALFGQGCFNAGMAKNTYGTGCFLLINTGDTPTFTDNGLLTTLVWQIGDEVKYALDGGVYIAGAALQWLRDGIGLIEKYSDVDRMAKSVADTGGLVFVPAFSGLAAPYWDQFARGTIVGITGSTRREHIVRATLESIAYQVKNVVDSMIAASGGKINVLKADGGITKSDFLMQFQADILGVPVEVPQIIETTALGAAFFAGLACGVWKNKHEIEDHLKVRKRYRPNMDDETRRELLENWDNAVTRAMNWAKR